LQLVDSRTGWGSFCGRSPAVRPPSLEERGEFGSAGLATGKLSEALALRDSLPPTTMDELDWRLLAAEVA
jgi:hypothetical protein